MYEVNKKKNNYTVTQNGKAIGLKLVDSYTQFGIQQYQGQGKRTVTTTVSSEEARLIREIVSQVDGAVNPVKETKYGDQIKINVPDKIYEDMTKSTNDLTVRFNGIWEIGGKKHSSWKLVSVTRVCSGRPGESDIDTDEELLFVN